MINNQKGMVALITILIISSMVLMITVSLSWRSTSELQLSWWSNQSEEVYGLANSCMEEGLNRLRLTWEDYDGSLELNGNSCIISITTVVDSATVVVTASIGDISRGITAVIADSFNFISWQEN